MPTLPHVSERRGKKTFLILVSVIFFSDRLSEGSENGGKACFHPGGSPTSDTTLDCVGNWVPLDTNQEHRDPIPGPGHQIDSGTAH